VSYNLFVLTFTLSLCSRVSVGYGTTVISFFSLVVELGGCVGGIVETLIQELLNVQKVNVTVTLFVLTADCQRWFLSIVSTPTSAMTCARVVK